MTVEIQHLVGGDDHGLPGVVLLVILKRVVVHHRDIRVVGIGGGQVFAQTALIGIADRQLGDVAPQIGVFRRVLVGLLGRHRRGPVLLAQPVEYVGRRHACELVFVLQVDGEVGIVVLGPCGQGDLREESHQHHNGQKQRQPTDVSFHCYSSSFMNVFCRA